MLSFHELFPVNRYFHALCNAIYANIGHGVPSLPRTMDQFMSGTISNSPFFFMLYTVYDISCAVHVECVILYVWQ